MIAAARQAKIGLAVLSPYYITKTWPLDELQIFLEQGTLIPLFYKARLRLQHLFACGRRFSEHGELACSISIAPRPLQPLYHICSFIRGCIRFQYD
jgi:hypothetical protein